MRPGPFLPLDRLKDAFEKALRYHASGQQLKRIGHLQMDLPQVNGATHLLDASRTTFLLKCQAGSGRRNG